MILLSRRLRCVGGSLVGLVKYSSTCGVVRMVGEIVCARKPRIGIERAIRRASRTLRPGPAAVAACLFLTASASANSQNLQQKKHGIYEKVKALTNLLSHAARCGCQRAYSLHFAFWFLRFLSS